MLTQKNAREHNNETEIKEPSRNLNTSSGRKLFKIMTNKPINPQTFK